MDKSKSSTIKIYTALMDLCWLYMLGALLTAFTASRLLPVTWLALIYAAAWLVSILCRGRVLILGITVHGTFLFILIQLLFAKAGQFNLSVVPDQLKLIWSDPSVLSSIHPYIITTVALIFWIGGTLHSRRIMSASLTADRLDLGAIVLLTATAVAGALNLSLPGHLLAITFFFTAGMIATYLSRSDESVSVKNTLIPLVYSAMIICTAIIPLKIAFFPLASAADSGSAVLQQLFAPLASFAARVLIFLFRGRKVIVDSSPEGNSSLIPAANGEGFGLPAWLEELLPALLLILLAAAVLGLFSYLFVLLIRYLTGKRIAGEKVNLWLDILIWLGTITDKIRLGISRLSKQVIALTAKDPAKIFKRYLELGKWFNQSRHKKETIIEYSTRLEDMLPEYKMEISILSEAFNRYAYGPPQPDNRQVALIKKASKRLFGIKGRFQLFSCWVSGKAGLRQR